eukprot:scaffold442_cov397-Prasinococcus_capsulatus_cf.AAC.3
MSALARHPWATCEQHCSPSRTLALPTRAVDGPAQAPPDQPISQPSTRAAAPLHTPRPRRRRRRRRARWLAPGGAAAFVPMGSDPRTRILLASSYLQRPPGRSPAVAPRGEASVQGNYDLLEVRVFCAGMRARPPADADALSAAAGRSRP